MEREGDPTSRITKCVLPLIASGRCGLNKVALTADIIAADARLNMWFADQKKTDMSEEGWLELLELLEADTLECEIAVRKFNENGTQQELARALQRIAGNLTTTHYKP
jgi:hypothetical protein